MNAEELQQKIAGFQGTKQIWYSPLLGADILFTDGIEFIKDEYPWLIEKIIECQKSEDWLLDNELQIWKLMVNVETKRGVILCTDETHNPYLTEEIENIDFPLKRIEIYAEAQDGGLYLCLPTEW